MAMSSLARQVYSYGAILLFASGIITYKASESLGSFLATDVQTMLQSSFSAISEDGLLPHVITNYMEMPVDLQPLPDALTEVTFPRCCDKDKSAFRQACLTEKACNSSFLYPFTSKEESLMFASWSPKKRVSSKHRKRCEKANGALSPQHVWCRKDNRTTFPFGCSNTIGMGGGSGPYDRLYLFPKGKLAFCGVPKAGITQWLQFHRFVLGAKDYQSSPYFKSDVDKFRFDKLKPKVQKQVWMDSQWTKAILIREPAERLLSAYLDKIDNRKAVFGRTLSFAEFIDILEQKNITRGINGKRGPWTGLTWMSDPHWRPQAWSCGLYENLSAFDHVGTLDTAANHTKALLQQVNMWDSFGKHYRVSKRGKAKGNAAITWPPEPLRQGEEAVGFQQKVSKRGKDGMDTTGHSKGSRSKVDVYYTPELMKRVKGLYWMDFALWDAVKEAEKKGIVHGKYVATKLNPDCS